MSEHTKEPWHVAPGWGDDCQIRDSRGALVAQVYEGAGRQSTYDACRIVACINALQGVPTEQLEEAARAGITDVTLGNLFSSRLALQKQRDQLREALKEMEAMYTHAWDRVEGGLLMMPDSVARFDSACERARAALAAAGGE